MYRSGRFRAGRRGVSPIIGEIMIVAITVVLAAVLAVMAGGLMRAPSPPPIGYNLAIFASGSGTSTGSGGGGGFSPVGSAPATVYQYTFMLAYAGTGLVLGDMTFQVQSAQDMVVASAGVTLSVEGLGQNILATYYFSNATWHAGPGITSNPVNQVITTENSLVVSSPTVLSGDRLVIYGQNAYSGEVTAGFP
jgi:flagellin-like protein